MKLLVIATEPVDADTVREALGSDGDLQDAEVLVIAPAVHASRLRFWMSDADRAIEQADDVQGETVANLDAGGVDAVGGTGEADPVVAIRDTLTTFSADRIVVFRHAEDDESYREDRLREADIDIPVDVREIER